MADGVVVGPGAGVAGVVGADRDQGLPLGFGAARCRSTQSRRRRHVHGPELKHFLARFDPCQADEIEDERVQSLGLLGHLLQEGAACFDVFHGAADERFGAGGDDG